MQSQSVSATSNNSVDIRRSSIARALRYYALPFTLCISTSALAAIDPPNPNDLTQGSWDLIPEKSTFCKPRPEQSRRDIVDVGWGMIAVHWTGIDHLGKPVDARYVWRYDGEKYPADIKAPAREAISWTLVNPYRVEFLHWSKTDEITEELFRQVSADGQEMTQSRAYLGGEGECVDVQVFRRI
jgi:hypothetical protein